MLQTRLWMGTILVLLTLGMLVFDQSLAPWYPFLFIFVLGLSILASKELVELLGKSRTLQTPLLYGGVILLVAGNWVVHWQLTNPLRPWEMLLGTYVALFLVVFLWEMATFPTDGHGKIAEGGSIERMARTLWAIAYVGLLPCFLVQARWLYGPNQQEHGSVALALLIFVPKSCDVGAYCVGRMFGRHPMTPVLSPKKTWEGAIGGLLFAALTAISIDRLGPVSLLRDSLGMEIGFGIAMGVLGMLGDLAESLLKRDCRRKDASDVVPGFGGVLDVVDALLFTAPVGYLWLWSLT